MALHFLWQKTTDGYWQDKQHSHDLLLYVNVMNYVKQTINDDRIKLAKPIKCQGYSKFRSSDGDCPLKKGLTNINKYGII